LIDPRTTSAPPWLPADSGGRGISGHSMMLASIYGVAALAISACTIVVIYTWLSLLSTPEDSEAPQISSWKIQGQDLTARLGRGSPLEGGELVVTELQPGAEYRAIFTRRVMLSATDYPFLRYQISGRDHSVFTYFIWRTEAQPEVVHNRVLRISASSEATIDLSRNENWEGKIVELGLDIYGSADGRLPTVHDFVFETASPKNLRNQTWSGWTALQTWTQRSINLLQIPSSGHSAPLSLTTAIWSGSALLCLALLRALPLNVKPIAPSYAITLAIPWIFFDLIWQVQLSNQLVQTQESFSGKSQLEKHLADHDAELYQYAQYLKQSHLGEPGSRVFLLDNHLGMDYRKLKLHYYLLPHNVFSAHMGYHPQLAMRPGDQVLVLDEELTALKNETTGYKLTWFGGYELPLTLVDDHSLGKLFQVRGGN
jgi:hypothetical protein